MMHLRRYRVTDYADDAVDELAEVLQSRTHETSSKLATTLRELAEGTHWAPDTEEAFAKSVPLHLDHGPEPCRYCA